MKRITVILIPLFAVLYAMADVYSDMLNAGIKAYNSGNYQKALTFFNKANEQAPKGRAASWVNKCKKAIKDSKGQNVDKDRQREEQQRREKEQELKRKEEELRKREEELKRREEAERQQTSGNYSKDQPSNAKMPSASELNDKGADYYYGRNGVSQDYTKAAELYRKSAEQGNATAQCDLGYCYEKGQGVSQDYYKAVEWYRKSAEQGDATAQFNLGVCYEYGQGVGKSISKAMEWYRKAADQGDEDAKKAFERLDK